MRYAPGPFGTSLICALMSLAVSYKSYETLCREDEAMKPRIGTLRAGATTYTIQDGTNRSGCIGAGTVKTSGDGKQMTLALNGWASLSLGGNVIPVKVDGTMLFNAMGQLTASLIHASIGQSEIKIGTLGINPISLRLLRGAPELPPLFEQKVPGPIEMRAHGDSYDFFAPSSTTLGGAVPRFQLSQTPRIVEVTDPNGACTADKAHAFDLGPTMQGLEALSSTIESVMRTF